MRYVVGYSANARGHDAVNLAVSLARGRGASLDLVLVVPEVQQFGAAHAPKAGFETLLNEQAREWLDEALALVPADVPAEAHIRSGDSDAQALIEAAEELGADVLVIGATSSGLFKRFTIGSVASALLHASTVPVALAPHGYYRKEALTRISCGLGTRAGAEKLLDFAIGMAANRKVPLRVVSLLALDGGDSADAAEAAREYAEKTVAAAAPVNQSGVQLAAKTDVVCRAGPEHRRGRGRPRLGGRRGPGDRFQPPGPGPLHLPGQHREPDPARPAGADARGAQRLRTQAPEPLNVE